MRVSKTFKKIRKNQRVGTNIHFCCPKCDLYFYKDVSQATTTIIRLKKIAIFKVSFLVHVFRDLKRMQLFIPMNFRSRDKVSGK